jgi:hypothetical protein
MSLVLYFNTHNEASNFLFIPYNGTPLIIA